MKYKRFLALLLSCTMVAATVTAGSLVMASDAAVEYESEIPQEDAEAEVEELVEEINDPGEEDAESDLDVEIVPEKNPVEEESEWILDVDEEILDTDEEMLEELESSVILSEASGEIVASGSFTDTIFYELDSNGHFRIFGTGEMSGNMFLIMKDFASLIKSVDVESGITKWNAQVLSSLPEVETIRFAEGIEEVGYSALIVSCPKLTKVYLPKSLVKMPDSPIMNCPELKTAGPAGGGYNIEYGWNTEIPAYAFAHNTFVEKVVLPSGMQTIQTSAFSYCRNLKEVVIPNSVKEIYGSCFAYDSALESINLPDSVTDVGGSVFNSCTSLWSVRLSENLNRISPNMFMGCISLEEILIPDSVTEIGSSAFNGCTALSKVSMSDKVEVIYPDVFVGCKSPIEIEIPSSMLDTWYSAGTFDKDNYRNTTLYGYRYTKTEWIAETTGMTFYDLYETRGKQADLKDALVVVGWEDGLETGKDFYSGQTIGSYDIYDSVYSYQKEPVEPLIRVFFGTAHGLLEEGKDYTVSLENNVNVGTATATITGIGKYKGTLTREFEIEPLNFEYSTVEASIPAYRYIETGSEIHPPVTVTYEGVTLEENVDYTVEYINCVKPGYEATIVIRGIGQCKNEQRIVFEIVAKEKPLQSLTVKAEKETCPVGKTDKITVTGAKGSLTFTSSNEKIAKVSASGVVTGVACGEVTITVTSSATSDYRLTSKAIKLKITPASPEVKPSNSPTGTLVTWNKVPGATGYILYRGSTKIKTFTSGSTVTFTDTAAKTNAGKYTYKVVPVSKYGNGAASAVSTTYFVSRPTVTLSLPKSKTMKIAWKANTKATGYEVQYSRSKTFASGVSKANITSAKTVNKTVTKLAKGTTWYVRVRTYKTVSGKKYYSAWSAVKYLKITK